ncbi:Cyclic di-GMP phosphodiesterase Gmr [Marinomonas spartinae]|uniref:Cyclic di-GMP phosphodiesterase Gmr n=1 Tax=Marinomonas spartinae TaxID=1792290 RepID=A0A1A8TQZ3_9GAMM|nr:bifunctional diguanylate cyclase/phosphodiesterase [Marinomonas spartinae]SBS29726.1 Cyclic di-GMP phosphodiesterase Gmr [Marinomonas spartinae]SBS36866.1 Cyclic di-GMP phosphodiesterase Gmr [Marinomonas spartinae]
MYSKIFEQINLPVWVFDVENSRVIFANAAALVVWNAPDIDSLRARDLATDMSPAVQRRLKQYLVDFLECDAEFYEQWTLYPDGKPVSLNIRYTGIKMDNGRIVMLCEGQEIQRATPEASRGRDALMHTHLMISLHTSEGANLYLNPAAREFVENSQQGLSKRFVFKRDYTRLMQMVEQQGEGETTALVHTVSGKRWHELTARACHDPVTGQPSVLISATDVSKLKEAEALASKRALLDSLTNLPNRHALPYIFEKFIKATRQDNETIAVLFIDLDEFKAINDTMGHAEGDRVLVEVAKRLSSLCGPCDSVVRLGGDEFFILTSRENDGEALAEFAQSLLLLLSEPITVKNRSKKVTPSIGIATYPSHGAGLEELMQSADIAMYQAKSLGRNQYCLYDAAMREAFEYEHTLLAQLKEALSNDEFVLHYQPRVSAKDKSVVSFEALLRWNHPESGLMYPDSFIDLCERSGQMTQIGEWVLREVIKQIAHWHVLGKDVAVSVNVSINQLFKEDFVTNLECMLDENDCAPNSLELELTESALTKGDVVVIKNLQQLRHLGVRVSVDDFGVGYSNFARLNDIAFDFIKIDRSLIASLPDNPQLVKMIISICLLMRAQIVAEGVENEATAQWLADHGCDELQGYLFSKPMSIDQATDYLFNPPKP